MPSDDGTAEAHARISTQILDTVSGEPACQAPVRMSLTKRSWASGGQPRSRPIRLSMFRACGHRVSIAS